MRVVAYMPVLNEADILPWTIDHLFQQGIERVRVLDGGSTDKSRDIAILHGAYVGCSGAGARQVCAEILRDIQILARSIDAEFDWCYYTDADEIRRSSRDGETLVDGITRVDALGFNVIDHKAYTFYPTAADRPVTDPPEQRLRRYVDSGDPWTNGLWQEKLWKNDRAVTLGGGGHVLERPDKRVAPEKFVLKHFPWRSQEHFHRKLAERLARRCESEHAKGWGVHYDPLAAGQSLIPSNLKYWPDPVTSSHPHVQTRETNLNLGCSDQILDGFLNVDVCEPCDQIADLRGAWPWPDSSIAAIRAHDIIEHLPDKIHTMNEAWRVLKPGGRMEIVVPTTDGRAAFQDPTHVSFWNRHSFWYYEAGNVYRERFAKSAGIRAAFKVLAEQDVSAIDGPKLAIFLEAVK